MVSNKNKRQSYKTRDKKGAHRAVIKTASARRYSKVSAITGVYTNNKVYQSKKYTKKRRKHQFK